MRRPGLLARRWISVMAIVLILLALVIWTIRPAPYFDWLGAEGLANLGTPLSILQTWAKGRLAPMTPVGLITLFPPADLLILAALLTALCVLLVLLPGQWRDQRDGSRWTRPIRLLRLPRIGIRVRTAMALIAILGLDLGWEIVAWRNWRLSEQYRGRAVAYGERVASWRESLKRLERQLAGLDAETSVWPEDSWTPAARAAQRAYSRARLHRGTSHASHLIAAYDELRRKYERATADPSRPVPPDPPPPDEHEPPDPGIWMAPGKYAQALAGFDELIRLYPDLVWAHQERAWILATCSDAKIRDGKLAVSAATRAAELTNWKDWTVFSTLAAAYAEAGDFANAVRWEQRGLEAEQEMRKQFPPSRGGMAAPGVVEDRLALYKAGKPFRMTP
jgi:tetratricopeptide (TPR) repeat protein